MKSGTILVNLAYPRNEGMPNKVEINLTDVRAADGILIEYDFDRDGWSIKQASTFEWEADDGIMDPDWQEVAFIKAWGRENITEQKCTCGKSAPGLWHDQGCPLRE